MVLCAADAHIWQRAVIQGFRLCDAITGWASAGFALGGVHCGAGGASVRGGGGKCMEQARLACDFSRDKKARHR